MEHLSLVDYKQDLEFEDVELMAVEHLNFHSLNQLGLACLRDEWDKFVVVLLLFEV